MDDKIHVLDMAGLAAARTTDIRWLWGDYLATGMVTLLIGHGKDGKTTLLSLLLERLQSHRPLAGMPVTARSAFVISEEPAEIWHHRAVTLGLREHVQWICRSFFMRPEPKEWMEILRATRASKPDLIVIDSLSHFFPENRENSPERFLQAIRPLNQITEQGTAVLVVHHPRKDSRPGALVPRGTAAMVGFADIVITLERAPHAPITDRRRVIRATSRLGSPSERWLELSPDGLDYAVVPEPSAADVNNATWDVLRSVLEDHHGELTQKEIRAAWPEDYETPSKATLARWLSAAVAAGQVVRNGRGRTGDPFRYGVVKT
ncbi:hypothetical protein BH11PLA2_BH11PLA2_02260 [soil metagenome]